MEICQAILFVRQFRKAGLTDRFDWNFIFILCYNVLSEFVNAVYEEKKDVINIIYYLYALVYCKIFYIWFKSILVNHEITLYGYFLSSDINWNGSRWIDIYCSSTIDHWWNYRTCNVTFVKSRVLVFNWYYIEKEK